MNILDITRRKQAQDQIQRQNIRLAALNSISQTVSSSLDLSEVLRQTIDKILEVLESDSVRIYLLDERRETLHLAAFKGLSDEAIVNGHMRTRKTGEGVLGETALTGEIRVIDNLQRMSNPYVETILREGLKSSIYIPLLSKGKSVGVMCVSRHPSVRVSEDYVEFLAAIGNQIGVAVDHANLYESITKAYQDLKEAQEQVVRTEKLASLGKLSATIAHEINNPIAAVLTYVRLMKKLVEKDRFKPERLEDVSRYLDTMESETSRCGEIVKNLLAFSRRSKTTIAPQSMEEVIDKTSALIAHDLRIHEIQLVKEIETGLPKVLCDFKQIQQALLNLMSNASEAMTKGGTLTVCARRSEREGFLALSVSDTGSGMTEEELKNIFEPFFTTKEEGKGVGLGLSVVYGIITRHNGSIEVESKPGKGSTFNILLPIAAEGRRSRP
jgi:two-component system NtrC family sensor kinase